jgi:hypothetical protein
MVGASGDNDAGGRETRVSDEQGTRSEGDPTDPARYTSPPHVPPDTTIFAGGPPSPAGTRRPLAYLAVVIGLIAMVGGAIFFARSVGQTNGTKTPEAAVQRMFDALSNEDFLGVIESLTPVERTLLSGRIQTMASELGRLGILKKDLDLGNVAGIDLAFTGLKYKSETLAAGFTVVELTAGTSTYRIEPASSPIGDFVRGLLPRGSSKTISGSDDLSNEDALFVAVQQDGSWFVSIGYSIAEQARREAGAPLPTFGAGVAARGADTPEAAVEGFLRGAALLDVRRLIELMPPGEMAALHDYAPLFLTELLKEAADARTHYSLNVPTLKLKGTVSGDEAVVKIDKIAFRLSVPDAGISVEYDGKCATVKGAEDFFGLGGGPICGDQLSKQAIPGLNLKPDVGIVAVREGGLWYVSPSRTVLDAIIGILKALQPSTLNELKQFFQSFVFGGFGGFGGGTFELPPGFPTAAPHA